MSSSSQASGRSSQAQTPLRRARPRAGRRVAGRDAPPRAGRRGRVRARSRAGPRRHRSSRRRAAAVGCRQRGREPRGPFDEPSRAPAPSRPTPAARPASGARAPAARCRARSRARAAQRRRRSRPAAARRAARRRAPRHGEAGCDGDRRDPTSPPGGARRASGSCSSPRPRRATTPRRGRAAACAASGAASSLKPLHRVAQQLATGPQRRGQLTRPRRAQGLRLALNVGVALLERAVGLLGTHRACALHGDLGACFGELVRGRRRRA